MVVSNILNSWGLNENLLCISKNRINYKFLKMSLGSTKEK